MRSFGRVAIAVVLVILVFAPRLLDLDVFLNTDSCQAWLPRSVDFYGALVHGRFAETLQSEHPGVTVMILSGASIIFGSWLHFGAWSPYRYLKRLLFYAKLPVALFTGLGLICLWAQLRRHVDRGFALAALVFLAIDPVFLAHSRQFHLDAFAAVLVLISLVASGTHLRKGDGASLKWSAIACALALLTRSSSLALAAYTVVALTTSAFRARSGGRREAVRNLLVWCGLTAAVFTICWPAMWVQPVSTLRLYLGGADAAYSQAHESLSAEEASHAKSGGFHAQFLHDLVTYRSVTTLAFAALGVGLLVRRWAKDGPDDLRFLLAYLGAFGALFLLGMSLFRKATSIDHGYRYVLVSFLVLQLFAAHGFLESLRAARRAIPRRRVIAAAAVVTLVALLCVDAFRVLRLHPYYQTFHNEFARPSFYGWGEGMELVARHLNAKPGARELVVASDVTCCLAYFFVGRAVPLQKLAVQSVDYVVLYNAQVYRGLYPEVTARYQSRVPEFVARINGVEYAWVYAAEAGGEQSDPPR